MFKQAEQDLAAGTVDFIIPAEVMDVAYVFSIMKQNKDRFGMPLFTHIGFFFFYIY